MKNEAFQDFKERILAIDPFLPIADFEKVANEIFHKLQNQIGIQDSKIDLANLFITAINNRDGGKVANTENSNLPADLNLTMLKSNSNEKYSTEFINFFTAITQKIVDPTTRELILVPFLMQNFSKPIDVATEMVDLIDGLRCGDGSKPKIADDNMTQISSEFIKYLQLFQSRYSPPDIKQMSLPQMFGILQSVSNLNSFGFAVKQPSEIGACDESSYVAKSTYQFPRFGLFDKLEIYGAYGKFEMPKALSTFDRGEIKITPIGISKPYTIMHEIFHMFLPNLEYSSLNLKHFDDFKFLIPLLKLSELIPITILDAKYPCAVPINYTKTEDIGAIDLLLTATTRNAGRAFDLSSGCNQKLRNPGDFFKSFCPDKMAPKLFMDTLYNKNLLEIEKQKIFKDSLSVISSIECWTAISRGIIQVFSKCLKLSDKSQEALESIGENATRIALIASDKEINATFNIAIFSGLISLAKLADAIMPNHSPSRVSQDLAQKIGEMTIGKEATDNIGNLYKNTPKEIKKLLTQTLFVFALYSIDELLKNLPTKDDKFGNATTQIDQKILIGFITAVGSALMGSALEVATNKMFQSKRGIAPGPNPTNREMGSQNARFFYSIPGRQV
jgi:hypothetical protein